MKRLISLLVLVSLICVSAQSEQHKIKGSVVYPPAGGGSPIETSTEATIEVVTDSDGDGLKDSDEDLNRNGEYDKETEPSNLFKADTDDDGVMDGVDLQPKTHNFLDAWEADAKDPVGSNLYASYNFTQVPSSPLGSKVNDISENSRHATARNSSTKAVTGVLTNATNGIATYGFDCSGSHHFSIDMKSPVLSFRSVETVSMWVYLPADSLSTEQPIFSYVPIQAQRVSNGAQVENTIRAMFRSVNGNLEFVFKNWLAEDFAVRERWTLDRPAAALEAGWHHLAFVWQGGNGASQDSYWAFYLDGRKQTRTKGSVNQFNPSSSLGQDTFVFGTDATGGSGLNPKFEGATFAGKFDRVRLYSDDLSAANIAKLVNQDTDGDGFSDVQERQAGRNPAYQDAVYDPQGDYDEDGIKNVNETNVGQGNWAPGQTTIGTNPLLFDTDGDMLGDGWEHQHNFNPFLASSPGSAWRAQDDDGDGLSNLEEFVAGTKHAGPGASDSDNDGYSDKEEMDAGSDPLDINSKPFKASEAGPDLSGLCGNLGAVGAFKGSAAAPIDEFNLMVGVGDYSISKSELWILNTDQGVLHQENSYGTFGVKRLYLKPNRVYKVSLMHGGSTEGEGQWDYAAFALPYSAPAWDYLQGEHNPGNGYDQADAFNNLQRFYDGLDNSPPVPETPSDFIVWNQDEKIGGHKLLDLVDNTGPPEDTRPAFLDALDAKAYLIPVSRSSYSSSLNLSSSDAAGPRYRKIGLNGMPLADEKPEGQGEVDQANEETYVDAFDLSLRHDTSFVYLPLASSDLVLQAAASVSETTWNDRSGINPHEQMTAPFGAGWTSNLSSYVEIAQAVGTAPKTDPVSVNVVDEDGRAQRFATADGFRFFAWPSGTTDRKSYLNTLEWKAGPSGNDEFLVLRKKFGNTLVYRKTPVWLLSSGDRLEGAENGTRHNYWRLQSVTDRYGNQLIYDYGAEWTPGNPVTVDNGSLIPKKIYCPQRPGQELTITRRDCRTVQSITDPSGRVIQFVYGNPASINGSENGVRPSQTYEFPVLRSVLFPDGTKNQYGYDMEPRYETILPTAGQDPGLVRYTWYFHVNVGSITDKKGKTHVFGYDFNDSVQYYEASSSRTGFYAPAVSLRDYAKEIRDYVDEVISEWNSQVSSATEDSSWKVRYGLPRQVTSVSRPGLPGVAVIFSRSGGAFRFGLPEPKESGGYHGTKPVYRGPESVTTTVSVTGGEGSDVYRTKYSFTGCNAELVDADIVTVSDPNSSNGLSNSSSFSAEWLLSYEGMTISLGVGPDGTSAQGTESYAFSPEAGYALVSSTGIYGDKTIWGYGDPWEPDNVYSPFRARGRFTKWADPVSKKDALDRTEQYQYGAYRVMTSSVDVHNTETSTSVDHLGRRTGMVIKDLNAGGRILRQESYFYDQPRFKSFMTKKIVRAFNHPTDKAWEKDIVSTYEADALGRLWRETTYPGGNPVVTTYEYNIFNQKTKVTDPRSNVTSFRYDSMNRLVEVDHPETMTPQGPRRSVTKTIYDSNGNKTVAIDENGHATIWLRDALNRVTHEIRDMDGKGIPFAATGNPEGELTPDSATPLNAITSEDEDKDLVTETFYNKVDAPVAQIDPRGYATVTLRDSISRPVHVFAGIPKTSVPVALSLSAHAGSLATMAAGSTSITHTEMVYPTVQVVGDEKIANVTINGTPFPTYPGGSIFASDGLKASETIHHDVVLSSGGTIDLHSYTVHDKVFRPTRIVAQYRTDGPNFDANHSTITTQFSVVNGDKEGRIVTSTDALGKETETELDAMGREIKVTERGNQGAGEVREITKEYSSTGLLFRTIDALGRHTEIDYDGAGRPVKQWSPDPVSGLVDRNSEASATLGSPATTSVYDGAGNVVAVINPLGYRTDFEYDARNRTIAEMLPPVRDAANPDAVLENLRPTSRTWYDLAGNAVASKDTRGNITRIFYDKANRGHASRSNPQTGAPGEDYDNPLVGDITTSQKLDEGGLPAEATDGNGNITRNAYDALGRLIRTITDPATGNPSNPADASFNPGVYQKANSTVILVTNEYDDLGNLVSVKDGKGAVTGFRYDGAKRKTRTIWDPGKAAEREEKWIYNALLLTERIDGRDLRTLYAYDGLHRLTDVLYGAAAGQATSSHEDNQIRGYDLGDRLETVNYPNEAASKRAVAYEYDELDRVVAETSAATTHAYTYDKAGNGLTVIYGRTGRMLISTYDALNRLETCVEGLASEGDTNTTSYLYDRGGKVTRKVLPNGNRSDSQYDFLGRTMRIVERNSHNSPLISFDYTRPSDAWPTSYDGAGNVLQVAEGYSSGMQSPVRTVLNTYDKANRLLREDLVSRSASTVGLQARIDTKTTIYAYDAGNNRVYKGESSSYQDNQTNGSSPELLTEYVYGSGVIENGHAYNSNQLIYYGKSGGPYRSFTYDANGNRRTATFNGNTDTYSWDFENCLLTLDLETGSVAANGEYAYAYDYLSRRISRAENNASGATLTVLSFSGGTSVLEMNQDGSGDLSVQSEMIRGSDWGGGVGGLLYSLRSGQFAAKSYNSRGDVVSQTDSSGAVTWQAAYEAFGTRSQETDPADNPDRQRANTKEEDPTGLLNEGFRYRDLASGVFISRDPAGFVDGPNVYTYVRQNPWSAFDKYGLATTFLDEETPSVTSDTGSEWRVSPPTPPEPPKPTEVEGRVGGSVAEFNDFDRFNGPTARQTYEGVVVEDPSPPQAWWFDRGYEETGNFYDAATNTTTFTYREGIIPQDASIRDFSFELQGIISVPGLLRNLGEAGVAGAVRMVSRGGALKGGKGLGFQNLEFKHFRSQGFNADQARYLMEPYPSSGMGHHFIGRQFSSSRGGLVPDGIVNNRLNIMGRGMSRGRFYERHFLGDPYFHGTAFPRSIGGTWSGSAAGLVKPASPVNLWYAAPNWMRNTGVGAAGTGAAWETYEIFDND